MSFALRTPALHVEDGGEAAPFTIKYNMTDLGNAERFVAQHGDSVHFVRAMEKWLVWDDVRWVVDETGRVDRLAKATVRSIYGEAAAQAKNASLRKSLSRWGLTSESNGRVKAMLERARVEEGVGRTLADFDADPWRLNVANGILDLRTGRLGPHDREARCRKVADIAYAADAPCPLWEAFLARILGDNGPLIAFVQRAVGYALTGLTTEQCLFFLHGRGANGKSTFLEILRSLLGEYALQADFTTLAERKTDSGPRNDIARLERARLVTASELGEGKRLNEELVKSLTGSDTITARFLHQEHFEFRPEFKLWIAANHKPVIRGTDDGIWRRVRLLPFEVQIPEAERDPELLQKLRGELPGILAWAVAGCLLWQRQGLQAPELVRSATQAYREESDVLGSWVADNCEVDPIFAAPASQLYANYAQWAKAGGEFVMSQTAFGRRLEERGHTREVRTGNIKWRTGLRLIDPNADDVLPPLGGTRRGSEQTPKPAAVPRQPDLLEA